ncbi:helix-turn-helix transcriptional regulator [Novosphingobium sp. KCTC 2891]|uniref:response regulator transcription factor n=1 Tax=Novosphingobium sp. KCTC 2891 TaxID=2989730 RepID=UPI00222281D4|nr:helix-turn-helix transcriptional regulator [Novosphingobium sp. KCTC 2891]MCW1382897.1 helix-turn-helix transcriptional regulator [Novosphingobium sp. KCTC 2891]
MLDDVLTHKEDVRLTARQADCIALVAKGLSSKEIGRELGISPSTVDNHIATAMHQFGFANRNAVARWYRQSHESPADDHHAGGRNMSQEPSRRGTGLPNTFVVGGIRNSLSLKERILSVAQVSILSIMATSAIVTFVLGLIFLLKLRM